MNTEEFKTERTCTKESVTEGDFFMLSSAKGYAPTQRKEAMQIMECWDKVMTVKSKGGCITKEYNHFEKVTDLTQKEVHKAPYFEDNRTYHK